MLEQTAQHIGKKISLRELFKAINYSGNLQHIPSLEIELLEATQETSEKRFRLKLGLQSQQKEGVFQIILDRSTNFSCSFLYEAISEKAMTVGDFIRSMFPALEEQHQHQLLTKILESELHKLRLHLTEKTGFSFYAAGKLLGNYGELGFCFDIPEDGASPSCKFKLLGASANLATSIPEFLNETMGLGPEQLDLSWLPPYRFAFRELSFDQARAKIDFEGELYYQNKETVFGINGRLEIQAYAIKMHLHTIENPLSLAVVLESLKLPAIQLPLAAETEIQFLVLDLGLDLSSKTFFIQSRMRFWDCLVHASLRIQSKEEATFLRMEVGIEQFNFFKLIDKLELPKLPKEFPDVTFLDLNLSIDSQAETIAFQSRATADFGFASGRMELEMDLKALYNKKRHQLEGSLEGLMRFADLEFAATINYGEEKNLSFKLTEESKFIYFTDLLEQITGEKMNLPPDVPEFIIYSIEGTLDFSNEIFDFSAESAFEWKIPGQDTPISVSSKIYFKQEQRKGESTPSRELKFSVNSPAKLSLTDQISLSDFQLAYEYKNAVWVLEGDVKANFGEQTVTLNASFKKEETSSELILKTSNEINIPIGKFMQLVAHNKLQLPTEINALDLTIGALEFTLDSSKNYSFLGSLALKSTPASLEIAQENWTIAAIDFELNRKAEFRSVSLTLSGENLPSIKQLDAEVKSFLVGFHTSVSGDQKADWKIDGQISLQAFQRYMTFKASAASLEGNQELILDFNCSEPHLYPAYFNGIEGKNSLEIIKDLNGGTVPKDKRILISELSPDVIEKLNEKYTEIQKTAILNRIGMALKSMDSLVNIPDLINQDKTLCSLTPNAFQLTLKRENGRFSRIDFKFDSNLIIYNTWTEQTPLFQLKNGILSSGYKAEKKEFYLHFQAKSANLSPLNIIALIPGIFKDLLGAFGETEEQHPKTKALLDLFEIQANQFSFIKNEQSWKLSASIRLILNDSLKNIDLNLHEFIEQIFPKIGKERLLEGQLNYDSKDGLYFILKNNTGIEIPNFLAPLVSLIDPQFKADFKAKTTVDLDQAVDIGPSFVILDQVRVKIAKDLKLDLRLAIGLPSKLNDRFFAPDSKLHGLINTYDRQKFEKAQHEKMEISYEQALPKDNLMRVNLSIGSEGISGQLEEFNVLNLEKISTEFEGFFTNHANHIELNFGALNPDKPSDFGKIKIDKFKFKLDFKTCSLTIGGGIHLESKTFKIPVRGFVKKLIALLPNDKFNVDAMNQIAAQLTESVSLKSFDFIDLENKVFNIDGLEEFLKQFLVAEHQQQKLIPPAISDFIKTNSAEIIKHLPDLLLEFLSIKIPAGIQFLFELSSDKSPSFSLEITEPSEAQLKEGYSPYLQVLVPDISPLPVSLNAYRLKKIGLGLGLFNQAIRLDLSGELASFPFLDLLAGAGLSILRHSNPEDQKLQHMAPDVKSFGQHVKLENLLMLIFPQTYVPIPVPVFYDHFSIYSSGLEGSKSEFSIRFPRPKLNITEAFSALGELVRFFKDRDFALPIASYGMVRSIEERPVESILPTFSAGPIYLELPGILGYQKLPDGARKKIQLGFKDLKVFNPRDLVALIANTGKYALLSAIEKKKIKIKIDEERSDFPINYLVKFLPETQRIGSQELVLFDVFEANIAWALSTPNEFKEKVLPLLRSEQAKLGAIGKGDTWTESEILKIIPDSETWSNEHEGVVVFFKGSVCISDQFILDIVTASSFNTTSGFASGIALRTQLAHVFDMQLEGKIKIDPNAEQAKFGLSGKSSLLLFGHIPVLKGSLSLGIGAQSHFKFSGLLDLFPDELFQGNRSPIQLYTGTEKAKKSEFTGIIDKNGVNVGTFNPDGSISPAGIHLEIGDFYLAGTTRIISTKDIQEWQLNFFCYDAILSLKTGLYTTELGKELHLEWSANQSIGIENIIRISGTEEGKGASGKLILNYPAGALVPNLKEAYLDSRISLFGLTQTTQLKIKQEGFSFDSHTSLGILKTNLAVSGKSFTNANSFQLNGAISLLDNFIKLTIESSFHRNETACIFKGSSSLEFWGAKRMQLETEFGTKSGNPFIGIKGVFDLSSPDHSFRLHTGMRDSVQAIEGYINPEQFDLRGSLLMKIDQIYVGGSLYLNLNQTDGFKMGGQFAFEAGLLAGASVLFNMTKKDNQIQTFGILQGNFDLIPNLVRLDAQSELHIHINEESKTLELFKLSGLTNLLGLETNYDVFIKPGSFSYHCTVKLPLFDFSIGASCSDLSSFSNLKLSGHLDLTKLNAEIDKAYAYVGFNIQQKMNGVSENKTKISNSQTDLNYRQVRIEFIERMNEKWAKNGDVPFGFPFCVPPISHMEYWVHCRSTWDWGRTPRYPMYELEEVRQYYRYKVELGLPEGQPTEKDRGDIVGIFQRFLSFLNGEFNRIRQDVSTHFRHVINDVNRTFNNIFSHLNIDTTDLNRLNQAFNDGLTILDGEFKKLSDLNHRLINSKLFELQEIKYTDQSIDILRTKTVVAEVKFVVLGEQKNATMELNLDDPLGSITRNLNHFIPSEFRI